MMPDSITSQLINGAWDSIKKAVDDGLSLAVPYDVPAPSLDTVAVVTKEQVSDVKPADWHDTQLPDVPAEIQAQVQVEQSGDAFYIVHHLDLSYHALRSPDTDAVKKWAAAARQFELLLMLQFYAQRAERRSGTPDSLSRHSYPDGWGQRRCVVLKSGRRAIILDRWRGTDMEPAAVKVDVAAVQGIDALVYRVAGGPYVRRPADLSLGWTPAAQYGARLLLTEQLEFVNARGNYIIGYYTTPPA